MLSGRVGGGIEQARSDPTLKAKYPPFGSVEAVQQNPS
jgi:hypothetical protein